MIFFEQLEYTKIKELLVQECQSEPGKTVASKLQPLINKKEIDHKLKLTSEIQECLKNRIYFNFENVSDVVGLLRNFHHQTYNFEEFRKIYFNISAANTLKKRIEKLEDYQNFYRIVEDILILSELEKRFNEIYFTDGEIKDSASSQLFSIRKRKKEMRKRIVSSLNEKIEDFASSNFLFDKVVTQRDGRFVIPVKEGSISFVKGIVHGKSASKSSVYMEPEEVVGLNNDIHILESEEKQEIFRILKKFSDDIQHSKKDILKNTEIVKQIDFYFASARFAIRLKAEKPKIAEKPYLNLIEARHPLLIESYDDYKKVIPFSLELGKDFKLLLISGPNTGGKTVTLKTVGLLTLMALSGLLIPAKTDSTIGIFPEVFADIGDNQSLENAMSTFSSHMKNIEGMVSKGNSNSLVLIDEIGASTDPEQGSALAQAILEKLVEKNVAGVITTHYTALKVFAEKTRGCMNAAMQFDPEKHLPTYQFKLGLPGNSFAIEVAAKLGLDEKLIKRAKELTGNQNVELTELLKKMGEEKAELARKNYQFSLKTSLLDQKISEHQDK
ncbi:MAG TPA: endonuclease MutS2, partial [Candidatus Cloacimonetes bacterium]|nr:endonuclease MutS2 [Candidatus Cloacimonadota bacterium]